MADRRKYRTFGVLDIGTSKIAAAVIVAEDGAPGAMAPALRVGGLGLQRAKGIKAGVLTDLDEAEACVRAAIGQAERAAGVSVDSVHVSVAAGRLQSKHFTARADIASGIVTDEDMDRAMSGGRAFAERDGRMLVHLNRLGLHLDGHDVREAVGLAARTMSIDLHAVTADEGPVRNLLLLIDRCYLACDGLIATPYASALAATSEEERQMGVTCIDLGAGTTSMGLYADGRFIGAEVLPVGSQHITFDIAKALQTPLLEAERIKTLYGTLVTAQSDEHEVFSYPLSGEDEGEMCQTTKARLTAAIRPRVAQILSLVRERLAQNPASAYAASRFVLTGGASQLLGLADFAAQTLGAPVRLGRPEQMAGLTVSLAGPQLATLIGLARISAQAGGADSAVQDRRSPGRGYLTRVGSWIKGGF